MDKAEVQQARESLLQMRREVLHEVKNSFRSSRELGQDDVPDIGDMSSNTYSQDVLLNLSAAQTRKLQDIDAALERLDQGVYGICVRCEEEIAPGRMRVRPFSRYCVDCKTDVEKFGE